MQKKKNLLNSDDIADQIMGQNDNTLGVRRANLELRYCQLFITNFNLVQ